MTKAISLSKYRESEFELTYKIFDRLRAMGIEDGDTVKIYDLEFDFFE